MKKHGFFIIGALLVTALIITCTSPIGDLGFDGSNNPTPWIGYEPTGGRGAAWIVADSKATVGRSIVPTTQVSDFKSWKLDFSVDSSVGSNTASVPLANPYLIDTPANLTPLTGTPITLEPGSYLLEVTAYLAATQTTPAAQALAIPVVITAGTNTPITINLKGFPLVSSSGTGTFNWNIISSGVTGRTAATMAIIPLTAGGTNTWTTGSEILLTGSEAAPSLPYTLASGYYQVVIKVTNNAPKTVTLQQILLVYNNLPSVFPTFTFTDAHFGHLSGTGTPGTPNLDLDNTAIEMTHSVSAPLVNAGTALTDNGVITVNRNGTVVVTMTDFIAFDRVTWYDDQGTNITSTMTNTAGVFTINSSSAIDTATAGHEHIIFVLAEIDEVTTPGFEKEFETQSFGFTIKVQ